MFHSWGESAVSARRVWRNCAATFATSQSCDGCYVLIINWCDNQLSSVKLWPLPMPRLVTQLSRPKVLFPRIELRVSSDVSNYTFATSHLPKNVFTEQLQRVAHLFNLSLPVAPRRSRLLFLITLCQKEPPAGAACSWRRSESRSTWAVADQHTWGNLQPAVDESLSKTLSLI